MATNTVLVMIFTFSLLVRALVWRADRIATVQRRLDQIKKVRTLR